MKIRASVPKHAGNGVHREVSAENTMARIAPYLRHAGITRVANITWLDRIGIPVYNAISPRSRDLISVYNGKGLREIDAKVSAVMEGVERFASWLPRRPDVIASFTELLDRGETVMRPSDYTMRLAPQYDDTAPISWTTGVDLLNGDSVLVPQHAAGYIDRYHEAPCYQVVSTNGLASGNSVEEALLHALCEVIERDAMTLAELVTTYLTEVLASGTFVKSPPADVVESLKSRHPHFDMAELPPGVETIVARFREAGVEVRMADITSDTGIPSVWCATVDTFGIAEGQQGHGGFGTHPDLEVAMTRALTECAQSRAVDIQAMREDISQPDEEVPKHLHHVHRPKTLNKTSWWWQPTDRLVTTSDVTSYPSDDVVTDLRLVLDRLRAVGVPRVIAIDLSPPTVPATVVRVIVPGMESWAVDQSRFGPRATRLWNETVATLAGQTPVGSATGGA